MGFQILTKEEPVKMNLTPGFGELVPEEVVSDPPDQSQHTLNVLFGTHLEEMARDLWVPIRLRPLQQFCDRRIVLTTALRAVLYTSTVGLPTLD